MNVRTPDPNPGWLSDEDLFEARGRLPMVYVEAVPVRLDPLGFVNEVGTLLQADEDGTMVRSLVSGRVLYRETIRAALLRHMEKDLGPLAFPQLPVSPVPFTVAEYFPSPSHTGFTADRQHAVALAYVIPVTGECSPAPGRPRADLDDPAGGHEHGRAAGIQRRPRSPDPAGAGLRRSRQLGDSVGAGDVP